MGTIDRTQNRTQLRTQTGLDTRIQIRLRNGLIVFAMSSLVVGCSAFLNSPKESTQTGGGVGPQVLGEDAFPEGFDPLQGAYSDQKFLAAVGMHLTAPLARSLRFNSEALVQSIGRVCASLDSDRQNGEERPSERSSKALELARSVWQEAMMDYHRLSIVGLEPFQSRAQDLYAWPAFGRCLIDQAVADRRSSQSDVRKLLYTARGLGAVEYLLFDDTLSSSCALNNPRFQSVARWSALPALDKLASRCEYALSSAELVLEQTKAVETDWDVARGNYSKRWSEGTVHGNTQEAMNALSNQLFMLERLKYDRLGRPLGARDCPQDGPCPDLVEHPFSGASLQAAEAQLDTALRVVAGFEIARRNQQTTESSAQPKRVWGFVDSLGESRSGRSRRDVGVAFEGALLKARSSVRDFIHRGPLQQQIQNLGLSKCSYRVPAGSTGEPEICTLFQNMKSVVEIMKTDFLLALSLNAPPSFQGDAD